MVDSNDPRDIHLSVMLERCVELLAPAIEQDGAVLVDATLGLGGHTEAFLQRFPGLTVVGLDRDLEAIDLASQRLEAFGDRLKAVHTVYDGIADAVASVGYKTVDAVLFDLGVSSLQLDRVERGFSYSKDAPLDMRMDATSELTAETVIAEYSEYDLRRIFLDYGEEKLAARYARAIVRARAVTPIVRSGQLVAIIQEATPAAVQRTGHPAKRVFQALRIEVNHELDVLERAIPRAVDLLRVGGRIAVMSFQSLEDRIVKRALQAKATSTAPAGLPVELPEHRPELKLLTRGAELADDEERARNPRAIPVRLRAAERVRGTT
ncbi:16S rRNA (cytosine(1402)-N(4))-methyltransferase RsmH [Planctomonas sp. JC2975]|uniref:16S rRNA (cytosine(1402)-N(4))-methyltransferase RsmH n=1 Tax=Planctomonas sp. JC2975 TaxID=2729626 RepID=UPI0014746922|nr:16S rRNA (cytosine(1402)-N(4))-methyltransferase RsmH [Planctomonas sp. JC2975]NNC10398.1 16S rRNA (cytosine(1402)-N(4))-methyltransferase RsmH [Planctomonas sp. JC2975]